MEKQAGQAQAARTLNAQSTETRLRILPLNRDLVNACAEAVVAHFEDSLPDLRGAVVLMPHTLQQRRLRRCLLELAEARGHAATLPPAIGTFRTLFHERMRLHDRAAVLSEHERKLLLVSALDEHPGLLPHAGRWEFAAQLLQLFDGVAAARVDGKPAAEPLSGSAGAFVQTLYNAWREDRAKTPDVQTLYLNSLRDDALTRDDEHVFLCGFNELSPCESAWATRLYRKGRLTLIAHAGESGRYASPALEIAEAVGGASFAPVQTGQTGQAGQTGDAHSKLIAAAFASGGDVVDRARNAKRLGATLCGKISVFKPESLEEHAFGIYLKIRDWLEAGVAPVAVAGHDRKLLRRLRAVLEHGGVPLCDHAGWALSTTSSAAAVAALLPPSDRDFDGAAVLTLARSPYCRYGIDVVRVQKVCARLERALAELEPFSSLDETIAALRALNFGGGAFDRDFKKIVNHVCKALAVLRQAAANRHGSFTALFDALFEAMDELGMKAPLRADEAGKRVLEELEAMAVAAQSQDVNARWNLWRRWILHVLERENFTPKKHDYLVEIYSLSQSMLARPAGLVIAALDTDHALPAETMPLLDEEARRALGLPGRKQRVAAEFARFRSALESAEHVLLTCQRANRGKTLTPAPWLDGLQHFHALVCGDDLEEKDLRRRAQAEARAAGDKFEDNLARPKMPAPAMPEWPNTLHVSDVQTAVACPYRFFAKTSLRLSPAPEADDYDSARDYGLRLHRCLAALHADVENLPGPVNRPWTEENRDYALGIARAVVEAEFAPRAERHYSAAERMQKAHVAVRWYVDWLIDNPAPDARFEAEKSREETFEDDLTLSGRADCVISENDGVRILDYKSGGGHTRKKMENGEDVQLTAYSLLHAGVKEINYMNMKEHREVTLEGDHLEQARSRLLERLRTFKRDAADKPFPAWADDAECGYCDYAGVCRRKAWRETQRA